MTAHELGRQLLESPDAVVVYQGNTIYGWAEVSGIRVLEPNRQDFGRVHRLAVEVY